MRWLIACVLLIASSQIHAQGPVFAELQVGGSGIRNGDLDFHPFFGSVTLGAFVLPNISLEVFADTGFAEGEDDNFELDIDQAFGIAARFQSPPVNGVQGFIVLGAVSYTLDQSFDSGNTVRGPSVNEEFTGVRVSVGLMQRLKRFPNLLFTTEYRHYNADEPIRLDALLIGLRVNAK